MEPEIAEPESVQVPETVVAGSAVPDLVVRAQGSSLTLRPGREYVIGRDPSSDIVVEEPLVSWRHAVLKTVAGQWLLEDAGSTNGTFSGKERVRQVEITASCQVRLGHPEAGPVVSCSVADGAVDVGGPAGAHRRHAPAVQGAAHRARRRQ